MNYISEGFWGGVKFGLVFVAIVAALDIIVVLFTMLQIGNGGYTPHIPWWDWQIRLIANFIK